MDLDVGPLGADPLQPHGPDNPSPAELETHRRQRVDTQAELRGAFAPGLHAFASAIKKVPPGEIMRIASTFGASPAEQTYPAIWDDLSLRREELDPDGDHRRYSRDRPEGPAPVLPLPAASEQEAADLVKLYGFMWANTSPVKDKNVDAVATGSFNNFMWLPTETAASTQRVGATTRYMTAPIGADGPDAAAQLLLTTRVMLRLAESLYATESAAVGEKHRDLLLASTQRGKSLGRNEIDGHIGDVAMQVMQEGIISLAQSLSLTTAETSSLAPADRIAVHIAAHIPTILAISSPMGFIGPLVLRGKYIPGLVTETDGVAALDHDLLVSIVGFRRDQWNLKPGDSFKERAKYMQQVTGFGCPVARSDRVTGDGGLRALSEAFAAVHTVLAGGRRDN